MNSVEISNSYNEVNSAKIRNSDNDDAVEICNSNNDVNSVEAGISNNDANTVKFVICNSDNKVNSVENLSSNNDINSVEVNSSEHRGINKVSPKYVALKPIEVIGDNFHISIASCKNHNGQSKTELNKGG